MRRKKASEIFGAVDPNLKVIDGGTHRWHRRAKLSPQAMLDWQKLDGAKCPRCGQDALYFRPQDGVCISCAWWLNEQMERKETQQRKAAKFIKAHNARIDKKRRG